MPAAGGPCPARTGPRCSGGTWGSSAEGEGTRDREGKRRPSQGAWGRSLKQGNEAITKRSLQLSGAYVVKRNSSQLKEAFSSSPEAPGATPSVSVRLTVLQPSGGGRLVCVEVLPMRRPWRRDRRRAELEHAPAGLILPVLFTLLLLLLLLHVSPS